MVEVFVSAIIREVLTKDPMLNTDEVVKRVKARGVASPLKSVKHVVHNLRKEFRKPGMVVMPVPARKVSEKVVPAKTVPVAQPVAMSVPATASSPDLSEVFANVALVNRVLGRCGGADNARHVAEAVRSCGGIDSFLQHLDLVAGIRQADATAK